MSVDRSFTTAHAVWPFRALGGVPVKEEAWCCHAIVDKSKQYKSL
jgi:hypothetical protein